MSNPETILGAEVRRALGAHARHARLFVTPRGVLWIGRVVDSSPSTVTLANPRRIDAGWPDGCADLNGWTSVTITPDMVGQTIAQFTSAELKTGRGTARDNQLNWRDAVLAAGGRAAIVRSPAEALELVRLP